MNAMASPDESAVWPRSPLGVQATPLAPRLDRLDGATIGFVWDFLFRGEELFAALDTELRRRYPTVEIVGYDTFGNIHGGDEAEVVAGLSDRLHRHHVDAVVAGIGC